MARSSESLGQSSERGGGLLNSSCPLRDLDCVHLQLPEVLLLCFGSSVLSSSRESRSLHWKQARRKHQMLIFYSFFSATWIVFVNVICADAEPPKVHDGMHLCIISCPAPYTILSYSAAVLYSSTHTTNCEFKPSMLVRRAKHLIPQYYFIRSMRSANASLGNCPLSLV